MIFDTDILSMLGKIDRIALIRKIFPKVTLMIAFEVYNELLRAREAGCKRKSMTFVTNDSKAKKFCEENDVDWLDIIDMLRLCYRKHVLSRKEIEIIIGEIEEKDKTRITKKEEIFA